jgi:hypothetical protein
MNFLLRQHKFDKIGKKKDVIEKRMQHSNNWKRKSPRQDINEEGLEENKREKLV